MSGPYDSYGGPQYNPPQGSSQYPTQGYGSGYPPQQGGYNQYNQQPQYPQHQQPYGGYDQSQSFGPPRRADSFGPPAAGGFQHGQAGSQFGAYDASNPQGNAGYYGAPQNYGGGNDAFAQNQAYQASLGQGGDYQQSQQYHNAVDQHQFAPQSSDPNAPNYDPKAPPMSESERGLLGSIGGGVAGHFLGKKANHGFMGTVGGAILGSLVEDFAKDKKKHGKHGHHHGSQSSWGGGRY